MARVIQVLASPETPLSLTNFSGVAYAAGDVMGTYLKIPGAATEAGGTGEISSVLITDGDKQQSNIDVITFADLPATSVVDNAAYAPSAADLALMFEPISVTTHVAFSTNSLSYSDGIRKPYKANANRELYLLLVCRGTPTYTALTKLTVRIGLLLD